MCLFDQLVDICRKTSYQDSLYDSREDCHHNILWCPQRGCSKYIHCADHNADPAKNKREMSIINLTITVKNTQQLDKVIRDLERKPDIDEVFRVTQ